MISFCFCRWHISAEIRHRYNVHSHSRLPKYLGSFDHLVSSPLTSPITDSGVSINSDSRPPIAPFANRRGLRGSGANQQPPTTPHHPHPSEEVRRWFNIAYRSPRNRKCAAKYCRVYRITNYVCYCEIEYRI